MKTLYESILSSTKTGASVFPKVGDVFSFQKNLEVDYKDWQWVGNYHTGIRNAFNFSKMKKAYPQCADVYNTHLPFEFLVSVLLEIQSDKANPTDEQLIECIKKEMSKYSVRNKKNEATYLFFNRVTGTGNNAHYNIQLRREHQTESFMSWKKIADIGTMWRTKK